MKVVVYGCYILGAVLALSILPTHALLADDAGNLDFLVATTGHAVTRFVHVTEDGTALVTSDGSSSSSSNGYSSTSCYIASRSVSDGQLLWRRNVCASSDDDQHHVLTTWNDFLFSMDQSGAVRAWTMKDGNLIWDVATGSGTASHPRLWTFEKEEEAYLAAEFSGSLYIYDAGSGRLIETLSAAAALEHSNVHAQDGEVPRWLSVLPRPSKTGASVALAGFVDSNGWTIKGNRMAWIELDVGDNSVALGQTQVLKHAKSSFAAYSLQTFNTGDDWHAISLSSTRSSLVQFSLEKSSSFQDIGASTLHPDWTSIKSADLATSSGGSIPLLKVSAESFGLFRLDAVSGKWEQLYGMDDSEATQFSAMEYCPNAEIIAAVENGSLKVWRQDTISLNQVNEGSEDKVDRHRRLSPLYEMAVKDTVLVGDGDDVEGFTALSCTENSMVALLSTAAGTTTQLTVSVADGNGGKDAQVQADVVWTAEDGLSHISSAIMLDATHVAVEDFNEEQDVVLKRLSFASRLGSQLKDLLSLFSSESGSESAITRRDHVFGFVKIAALLSQSSHRLWGMSMAGKDRGTVRWTLDLPRDAERHIMVHGTANAPKAVHGINGGTHSREILVLSYLSSSVEWTCLDGTNGVIHAEGSESISSSVVQVLPIYGGTGACRQLSLLLHEDRSLTPVPNDEGSREFIEQHIKATPNGFFAHIVDTANSKLQSFQVSTGASTTSFVSRQVGQASFSSEKIVSVSYPIRDEVVQSMCTVLGDDSLLLKYINPHVAVIVTMLPAEEGNASETTALAAALARKAPQGVGKKKRKPAGVGDATSIAAAADATPNMFVNVVDTVSGRVLHRTSHADVDPAKAVSTLITENWILYTFVNAKTKRTELGVLTLHEGMIDSKGLTAFTSPEQTLSFSSFDARESKPVVLAKTYTFPKQVTALGSTTTRGGISNRLVLIASIDGKITGIEKKMLETRRPTGEVKDAEKKEGLFRYMELIPEVPLMALSYNQTVDSVQSIVSAPTALESQSLVFAFGGPDLFFIRTSPSKGFDLLPDSFSRILVSIVVLGLLVVVVVMNRMASDKEVQHAWR